MGVFRVLPHGMNCLGTMATATLGLSFLQKLKLWTTVSMFLLIEKIIQFFCHEFMISCSGEQRVVLENLVLPFFAFLIQLLYDRLWNWLEWKKYKSQQEAINGLNGPLPRQISLAPTCSTTPLQANCSCSIHHPPTPPPFRNLLTISFHRNHLTMYGL